MQSFIGSLKENKVQLLRNFLIVVVTLIIFKSCLSQSRNSLPAEVHELIDRQFVNCVNVKGSAFEGGNQLESECSTVTTRVVGKGKIPPQEKARGISQAICYRIEYENPYFWAPSQTQYEEIEFAKRTASKVTVLQHGKWVIFPDQETLDRERWTAYSCPGVYEVSFQE